jgi:phosphohistidine phosphatase
MVLIMRLMLMRHAETEKAHGKEDFQRVLTTAGKKEADNAAEFLCEYQIDKVLVSYAQRAMQTLCIISQKITFAKSETANELYEGNEQTIINIIKSQEDHHKHLLIIGHNPLIYNIALILSNSNSDKYNDLLHRSMPTAQIVVIDFYGSDNWEKIQLQTGEIVKIFSPSKN